MNDSNVVIIYVKSMSRSNSNMFGISRDRTIGVSTLLGVAGHHGSITSYKFSLFLTFRYVSNFPAIRGFDILGISSHLF